MGGCSKTSTHDVIANNPRSPFLKSKMGTASVATPMLSGHLDGIIMLVIDMQCCLTSLVKGTSQTNKQGKKFTATKVMGLVLVEVATVI